MCKGKHKKKKIRINDLAIKSALLVVLATLSKMNCRGINKNVAKCNLADLAVFLK